MVKERAIQMNSSNDQIVWKRSKLVGGARKEMEEKLNLNDHHSKKTKSKGSKVYKLISYPELPDYMKDNEYIIDHYRANWPLKHAFFSLFRWHNETLNVWTHLIGFVVFLGFTVANIMELPQLTDLLKRFSYSVVHPAMNYTSQNSMDFFIGASGFIETTGIDRIAEMSNIAAKRWPFFVFLGGSMFCLLTSSICHLFCCHSHHLNIILLRFDYTGIAVMIITSFFPPIYYIFQCNPLWQVVYLTGITAMGVLTVITLLAPSLSTKHFRRYRAMLFFSMGFSGIIPAVHAMIVNWSEPRRFIALAYESTMAVCYAVGTVFYVTRVPERWRPGWFDLVGHSHQIFHIFVIMGALTHYAAALLFMDWRDTVGCV